MNKYKTFEELKEELGDKFEDYMYKANIELLTKIDKAIEYITSYESINTIEECDIPENNEGLDEDTFIEMIRRYMIVHDKLLNILEDDKDE